MRVWLGVACLMMGFAADPAGAQNLEPVQLVTASGSHTFKVEVVSSRDDMEKGLMYRHYMPEDRGMLFNFKTPQPVMMWMKNTFIALDMVFIDKSGHVINVAENAEPMSEAIISAGGPTVGVLELNGGEAKKIGLRSGDRVVASIFPRAAAQ